MLWGGWGERKRERAGHDGKGEERREAPAVSLFPSFPARFLFLSIIDILMGIPSGSLCGGESDQKEMVRSEYWITETKMAAFSRFTSRHVRNVFICVI